MANRADREEIFEYSGEESLESTSNSNISKFNKILENEDISNVSINPKDAFQYFHSSNENKSTNFYDISGKNSKLESPWEKLRRLQGEIDDLQNNLDQVVLCQESEKSSLWEILHRETNSLKAASENVKTHSGWNILKHSFAAESDLLIKLKEKTESDPELENKLLNDVKYDFSSRKFLELENRVYKLEALLGADSSSLSTHQPLLKMISHLEQRISLLSPEQIDAVRVKANSLKLDIEATTSKSSKSSSSTQIDCNLMIESLKKVELLSEQIDKVESVAEEIPSLIIRLKTLESIHWNASTFNSRLSLLESDFRSSQQELLSNKDVINEIRNGLMDNLRVMQENIKIIEEKAASSF